MDAVNYPLVADRGLWFEPPPIYLVATDLTGASLRMQVRQEPDESGTPNASLTTVTTGEGIYITYAATTTVANHIAAGRMTSDDAAQLGLATTDSLLLSGFKIRVSNTTMASMPAASTVGEDLLLAYDLLITLAGSSEQKYLYGTFTVRGKVTQ